MHNHFGARGQKGMLIEIVCALQIGMSGERGVDTGSPKEVQRELGLVEEPIPFTDWEVGWA